MRSVAMLSVVGALLLCGCPGDLENPERFLSDGGKDGGTDGGFDAGVDCTDVEKVIFKPSCGGAGCHESPSPANNLDLLTPGVGARIAAATSTCQSKPMTAFMIEKLKTGPSCGATMPLGLDPLSPAQLKCVQDYLNRLGDGGV